jgi:PAS domain S-box-containing protein
VTIASKLIGFDARWRDKVWVGYAMAVVATTLAAWLRWGIDEIVGSAIPPYMLFYPGIIFSALLGGGGAGAVATILSAGVVDFFFLQPTGSLAVRRPVDLYALILFVVVGLMISWVGGAFRAGRRRSEEQAREMSDHLRRLTEASELKRLSEERYRKLFENMVRGFAHCQMLFDNQRRPVDFIYLDVNSSYHTLTGLQETEGKRASELDPQFRELYPELFEIYGQVALTGQPARTEIEFKPLGKWFSIFVYSPEPEHFTAMFEDITERRHTEQQLRLQSAAMESAADAIIITDREGTIQWVNQAFTHLTGYSASEALGKTPRILKSGGMPSEFYAKLWETIVAGQVWHGQLINKRKDGQLYAEEMTIAPVRDGGGQIVNFVAVKNDISARQRAEEEAREAREALARVNAQLERRVAERTVALRKNIDDLEHFSHALVHDMRAPLRAMRSFSGLLLKQSKGRLEESDRSTLQLIVTAAQRMDQLIVDALDYSKAMRETLPLSTVDADALLRGMLESYPNFHPSLANIQIEGRLGLVRANQAGLTQCFSNLLSNAVKFVPPGCMPQVRVYSQARGQLVRLWFEDNGIGILPELHDRIFEIFQRVSADYEGNGIGLALVRKVVERMGGSVGVESEAGKGSRFWLDLPPAGAEEEAGCVITKPILYVEDDPHDVLFVRLGMAEAGLSVPLQVVVNGQEAVDYLAGNPPFTDRDSFPLPSLVLLDLNLPLVSGLEVLQWIREQPQFESLPVVIFSASALESDQQKARQLGANDYILKPSDMLDLAGFLRGVIHPLVKNPA